ncbi:MAG TPA: helix-turn-helix transcriptional regulator [Longimicrobiales bacterium]|nr:helix-turn-helix transcriptional regulator [Longimicrobiales bacterium]
MAADPTDHLPLPDLTLHVLLALAEGPLHGWAVVKRIEGLTQGRKSPSSGSLYLAIVRLEDRGLLEEVPQPEGVDSDDERRRYHRLTPLGHRVLAAEIRRLSGLVEVARGAGVAAGRGATGG